jgi:co-chaperonin GroES (HSP10)
MFEPPKLKYFIKGNITPIHDRVLVSDMEFGESRTKGGLIIGSDDGHTRGIKPRWCKVVSKGHKNKDTYKKGDWILVEHGRWSRGFSFADENGKETVLRIVEAKAVMMTGNYKPKDWYQARLKYSPGGDLLE